MNDLSNFIDKNGNFTHTKLHGTKEQILSIIEEYKKTKFYEEKTDSQKIFMEQYFFPEIISSGIVPNGILLELIMPSTCKNTKLNDLKGSKITFDLPSHYQTKSEGIDL